MGNRCSGKEQDNRRKKVLHDGLSIRLKNGRLENGSNERKLTAYSALLAERIRHLVSRHRDITGKKMFGGVCFLLNGNILMGLWKDLLIACVSKDSYEAALLKAYVGDSTLLASQ
jgi:hypothetical protein